ncbi:MFS transporter [Microcella humidisoli]|uniref:MFS transporter n=1 Tax=Microcella humidisoli TaxID=2963406 RepID=A0ABY5FTK8_9MICO|nr:MFS transporter [Microcella humidisoli]UTT61462.1 MFS transporter [Microcella humidisoli]
MRLPWSSLLLLSAGIFVAVTSEFLPIGLLPQLRDELGITEAQVGMLITVFAGTVVVATAPLTHLTRAVPRKRLLIVLLAIFAVANLVAALAPSYAVLVVARVIGGAAHGVFWAVVSPYAARLVPPERLASAVAIATSGATVATVAGVPLGTLLGSVVGWRASFAVIAGLVVVIAALIVAVLPPVEHRTHARDAVVGRPARDATLAPVLVLCTTVVLVTLGHATFYTYIAAWVIDVAGFEGSAVAGVLLLFGAAGAIGVAVAGVLGDRFPRALLPVLLVGVGLSVAGLAALAAHPFAVIVLIVLWSAFLGGVPVIFQARLLQTASPALLDIAAAWLTVAFNIGIGGGALLGGFVIGAWSLAALPLVTVALLLAAIGLVAVVGGLARPSRHQISTESAAS